APSRLRSGETITATRSAPASRAAITGQAIIGRPQIGCSTFGSDERILVPSPAAMISTVGPLTREIVESRGRFAAAPATARNPGAVAPGGEGHGSDGRLDPAISCQLGHRGEPPGQVT